MDYNQAPDTPGQISKYNDAIGSIMRLNALWISAEYYANSGQLTKWKFKLDSVWRELFPDILRINNSDSKKFNGLMKDNEQHMFRIAHAKGPSKFYYYINERHKFLRGIQDLAGKAGVYIDEDEDLGDI